MRIALVHSFYSSAMPSGENAVVIDQLQALQQRGLEVALIQRSTDALESQPLFRSRSAIRVLTRTGYSPITALSDFRPDIVHVHNTFPHIGTKWLRAWQGPVVMSIHNYRAVCSNGMLRRADSPCFDCSDEGVGVLHPVVHRCYRHSAIATLPVAASRRGTLADLVESRVLAVTTSDESDALFRRITHGAISTKVVPNFVADVRAEDGAAAVRQCWLALGRLTPEKGLMELVRDWPDHHGLLIVGSGPQKQDLMSLVKHRVNVELRDAVSRDQMRDLIETHQGLVFPSQWHEAAPQVVVEAMRSRKPVVANRASLVADLVARTGSGSVYASRQELTESLDLVASRPSMFGANARALYELEWTPDVWFERMMQVYNGVA